MKMKMPSTPSTEVMSTDMSAAEQWSEASFELSPRHPLSDTSSSSSEGSPEKPRKNRARKERSTTSTTIEGPLYRDPIWPLWTQCTNVLHTLIRRSVVTVSVHAAKYPKSYVCAITIMSMAMLAIGFVTNFTIETEYEVIYAPYGRRPTEYLDWIYRPDTGFPPASRPFTLLLHNQGSNVITKQGIRQLFQVLEVLNNVEGYNKACARTDYSMEYPNGTKTENSCNIIGTTRFWYYDSTLFEEQVETDLQLIQAISNETYPDGVPVNRDFMFGQSEWTNPTSNDNIITFAKSFQETILFPETPFSVELETKAIESLLALQQQWREDAAREEAEGLEERTMQLEFFTMISYATEFQKAIFKDLPLTVLVGVIMVVFNALVFFKRDPVQSRSLLGIVAVFTISMSMAFGHGLMFAAGVPFTNMTMMLPFVVFGVGLDDTFIVTGAFFRTDPNKDTVERIRETMEEVASSISLTTITTMLAFALGYTSSIPAIQWLCLYAFVSITLVFLYQITLFTAFLVLDERRVKASKRDLCFCITVKGEDKTDREVGEEQQGQEESVAGEDAKTDIMAWYADFLMRPSVKVIVLATFLGYLGFCTYRATLLTQEFIISEFLPAESYVADYLDGINDYATEMVPVGVYFRDIDQSNETVQQQMREYIDGLINLEQMGSPPPFCWVRDLANEDLFSEEAIGFNISSWSFNDKLNLALSDPRIRQVYGEDIVRDEDGNITASRCYLFLSNIDFEVVQSQIQMLNDFSAVTVAQPLNQGQAKFRAFAFTDLMFLWEFYSVCVSELTATTIAGVVSVTVVAFLLIPHWTAVFYVFPLIVILYVDMLGTLQLAGLHINAVTYVCLTVSIGLLVDFIMHVMLRYNESKETTRDDKVKDTLKTMGMSIMVGGLSTFIAVIPLAFSTSAIIGNVFTCFFAMVTLGVSHGLIFLPVVLSLVGPTHTPRLQPATADANDAETEFESRLNTDDECNESKSPFSNLEATSPMSTTRHHGYDELSFVKTIVEV